MDSYNITIIVLVLLSIILIYMGVTDMLENTYLKLFTGSIGFSILLALIMHFFPIIDNKKNDEGGLDD